MFPIAESFLDHVKWLRRATKSVGAEFIFAGDSMQALLRKGERQLALHPQFLTLVDGSIRRTPHLHDESGPFLGWLPYRSKHWPIAVDRLAFKRFASEAGLPVPAVPSGTAPAGVVVRQVQPSFEPFIAGPFRTAADRPLDAKVAEYYEPFIDGEALTVWYWNGQPLCAESATPPTVTGDGKSQVGELLVRGVAEGGRLPPAAIRARLAECDAVAKFLGRTLSTVLPAGEKMTAGLGHGSPLNGVRERKVVSLTASPATPELGWLPLMRKAGPLLLAALPAELRPSTLFSVNATVDREGAVWLLDMDASPRVHPLTYGTMLASLLGLEQGAVTGAQPLPARDANAVQPTRTP
jgi:hypothetical protein